MQPVRYGPGDDASAEGEAVARLNLIVDAMPVLVPEPATAMTVSAAPGAFFASVSLVASTLTLTRIETAQSPADQIQIDLIAPPNDTVAGLIASVDALTHWSASLVEPMSADEPSVSIINDSADATSGDPIPFRIWL